MFAYCSGNRLRLDAEPGNGCTVAIFETVKIKVASAFDFVDSIRCLQSN